MIADARGLNKSILEPLTGKQMEAKSKEYPDLFLYDSLFESIREQVVGSSAEVTYRDVTYKQMLDYLSFVNSDIEPQNLREKAKRIMMSIFAPV